MNAKERRSARARILVIEDDDEIREALQLLLGGEYDLVGLSDGAGLLDMIDGHEPDLVILDVNLPGRDGFELCRLIRSTPRHRHLPVMFLTARRDDESFARTINANADAFLNKPFEPAELKGTIERLVCPSA